MIYAAGSKLFKAVVVFSAGAHAHASCCGGEGHDHASSGQGHVHDLADKEADSDFPDSGDAEGADAEGGADAKGANPMGGLGDMLGGMGDMFKGMDMENMDFEAMLKNMGGMEGMQDMLKGMGGMDGMMGGDDKSAPAPPPAEEEVTEEQFLEAKEKLELSDDDMNTIVNYVSQVPAHFKDDKMGDEKLSKMFVFHYLNGEPDEQDLNEDGTPKEKNRENLLKEVQHLVEVEIPGIEAEEKAAKEAAEAKKAAEEAAATEAAPEDDGEL